MYLEKFKSYITRQENSFQIIYLSIISNHYFYAIKKIIIKKPGIE